MADRAARSRAAPRAHRDLGGGRARTKTGFPIDSIYGSRLTIVMSTPGEDTLEYYVIDKAGNVETTERKMLRRTR